MVHESKLTGRGLFSTRSVPVHAKPELLKRWIRECCNNHNKCRMPLSPIIYGLWVINVESRQLVNAPKYCQYFALSYVYGGVKINKLAKDLPQTIEDAIQLVRILGYRYLWIDSLCLTKGSDARRRNGYTSTAELIIVLTRCTWSWHSPKRNVSPTLPMLMSLSVLMERIVEIRIIRSSIASLGSFTNTLQTGPASTSSPRSCWSPWTSWRRKGGISCVVSNGVPLSLYACFR